MSVSSEKALLIAGGAVAGAWALDRFVRHAPPGSPLAPTRAQGMDQALTATATLKLPCGTQRLSAGDTKTVFLGAPIRRLASGAGEDFYREFLIQRSSLVRALGDIGIAGLTDRPKMSARCSLDWLRLWLDSFQSANTINPKAFALDVGIFGALPTGMPTQSFFPITRFGGTWRTAQPQSKASRLFKPFEALRALERFAAVDASTPLADVAPWIKAREVTEAIGDFAAELDLAAMDPSGNVIAEALAVLRRDLQPVKYAEKAVELAAGALDEALKHVAKPALSALLSTLLTTIGPWLVIGGVSYFIVKRGVGL